MVKKKELRSLFNTSQVQIFSAVDLPYTPLYQDCFMYLLFTVHSTWKLIIKAVIIHFKP